MFSIKSLRVKTLLWALIPTAIVMAAAGIIALYAYEQVARDVVQERDTELARISAARLSEGLSRYSQVLKSTAADVQSMETDHLDSALKEAQNQLYVFDAGVVVYDSEGVALWSQPFVAERQGTDCPVPSEFHKVSDTRQPAFSNVFKDEISGEDVILIGVPIVGSDDEVNGMLAGMATLRYSLLSTTYAEVLEITAGYSGYAYLVDGNGQVIYHRHSSLLGTNLADTEPVMRATTSGEPGAVLTEDATGETVISGFAPVPGTGWGLITQERWENVVGPIRSYSNLLLGLLVVGGLLSGALVFFSIGRVLRPIQDLTRGAQRIAGGDFDYAIAAKTGDEIQALAQQFNTMASALKQSYSDLERRVAERTKELATLNAVAQTVSRSLELEAMLTATLDKVLEALEFESGAIYLKDLKTDELQMACHCGLSDAFRRVVAKGMISARAAESGNPIIIDDLSKEPDAPKEVVEEGYRSVASIPLLSKGQVQGVLTAASRQLRRFRQQDVDLLLSIGHQIGVAIENARFFEAEQRRAEQFRVISEVGRRITSILAVDELLGQMARLIQEAFNYYHVTIGLVEGDEVVYNAGAGPLWDDPQFQLQPARLKVGEEGITGWVADTGDLLLVPDVSQEPRYVWMRGSETRSELTLPVKAKGEVIGVLDVQSDQLDAFDESDLLVLQSLAHQAAVAIENARLFEQAQQAAVMQERNRLARELHDAVTQTLFSASLIAEALPAIWESDQDEGQQLLQDLRQLSRGALAEMRTLLMELRPAALVEANLGDLLRQLGEAVAGRMGVPVTVTVEDQHELPPDVHVALYRIAQEALNNVVKHARASQVAVSLRGLLTPPMIGGVELHITDDGRGFDPSCVPSDHLGLGLGIIRERAEAIGATLNIESQPGHGTQVMVVWERKTR